MWLWGRPQSFCCQYSVVSFCLHSSLYFLFVSSKRMLTRPPPFLSFTQSPSVIFWFRLYSVWDEATGWRINILNSEDMDISWKRMDFSPQAEKELGHSCNVFMFWTCSGTDPGFQIKSFSWNCSFGFGTPREQSNLCFICCPWHPPYSHHFQLHGILGNG